MITIMNHAQEEKYKQSLQELSDAEQEAYSLKKELSEQRIACDKAEEEWNEAQTKGRIYGYEKQYDAAKEKFEKEKTLLDEKQAAYDNSESQLKSYYDNITMYEEASSLIFQGKTDEAIALLDKKNQALKTAADVANETAEEQRQTLDIMNILNHYMINHLMTRRNLLNRDWTLPKSTRKMRQKNMKRRGREP